jgi:hypothetical protein
MMKKTTTEVQNSVVAQLLLGLAIEGTANEVGDALFSRWPADRFENADTAFKWWFLSAYAGRTASAAGLRPIFL